MAAEELPTLSMRGALQDLLRESLWLSCGEWSSLAEDYPVLEGRHWRSGGDFECFTAAAVFSRAVGLAKKREAQQSKMLPPPEEEVEEKDPSLKKANKKSKGKKATRTGTMRVQTVSPFGLVREREYHSAREVAEGIVSTFEFCNEETVDMIADVRISGRSSCITITTKAHMDWHLEHGRLPCSVCGRFFKGPRGLRYHQIIEHKLEYFDAQRTALDSELQLILYTHSNSSMISSSSWNDSSNSQKERARDKIGDEGLEKARSGDLEGLRLLVSSGWNAHTACDKHGNTALMWAAGEGHIEVCKYLVETCGVNVHEKKGGKYKKIRHALHWAARNGRITVCDWLIREKGVDVDVEADDGTVPLHFAVWTNNMEMVRWLVEVGKCSLHKLNSYGCNASQWGALNGDVEMLKLLQSYGLDLKILNYNGHSAIHKAAVNGRLQACKWLLLPDADEDCSVESGGGLCAAVHMRADRSGNTPATIARNNGHFETAAWLDQQCPKSSASLDDGMSELNIESSAQSSSQELNVLD